LRRFDILFDACAIASTSFTVGCRKTSLVFAIGFGLRFAVIGLELSLNQVVLKRLRLWYAFPRLGL
jgi:hypothetical protein